MKKTFIKILSAILCLLMINIPVFAENSNSDLVEITEDFSKYSSDSDFAGEWGTNVTSSTAEVGFENGSYNIIQTNSIPFNADGITRNGKFAPEIYGKFSYEKRDEENKTVIKSQKLQGVYEITVDVDYKAITSLAAYYNVMIGDFGEGTTLADKQNNIGAKIRLTKTSIAIFNSNSADTNSMSVAAHEISEDGNNTLKYTVDTNKDTISVEINGDTAKISEGSTMHNLDAVSGLVFQNMERMDNDSYLKIKKVTIKEIANDAGNAVHAVLDSLPLKLSDDVNKVTDDIKLPAAEGLTWESSDESVISSDGKVTRGADDKEVKLTATVDLGNGGGIYTKEYTMTVSKTESDVPEIPDNSLYKVVVDYTKYNDISEVPDITTSLGSYADVVVTKGRGLEILQKNSLPVVNGQSNTNTTPTVHIGFQGVVREDEKNNTQLRVSKFGGKLKVDMDVEVKCDSYSEPVDGVTVSTPYYQMYYGFTPSLGEDTAVTFAQVYLRMRSTNATVMNTTKAADNSMIPSTLYYTGGSVHKISATIDTYNSGVIMDIDGNESKGKGQISSYFNGLTLKGMDRMKPGSYLNIKKAEISLLEANDDYNQVMEKLNSLPASLAENPDAVTENIVIPEVSGIKWSTSDSGICDLDGNINRWYSDRQVVLTATYGVGHTVMHKDYILNIKALDNVYSKEVVSASGEKITNIKISGDTSAGKYSVSPEGLKAERQVKDAGDYTVGYPLYGEDVPYSADTNSSVASTGYSGIYDVSFRVTPNIQGDVPVQINVTNNDCTGFGLEVSKKDITLVCANGKRLTFIKEDTSGKTYDITLRADTDNGIVWILADGKLKNNGIAYSDDSFFISLLNINLPKGGNEEDSVVIDNISVTEFVRNKITEKSDLISALNKISVMDITRNPPIIDSIGNLKESVDGYDVSWSCESDLVDIENQKIYHDSVDKNIIITAAINKNGVYAKKDFYLTVRAYKNGDEQQEFYLHGLPEYITMQPDGDIRYSLNLPASYNGLEISWSSSRPDIISNTGLINASASVTEPASVVLTAGISINGNTVYKNYNYTVSPYSGSYVIYSGDELPSSFTVNGTDNIKVTGNTTTTVRFTGRGGENNAVIFCDSDGNEALKIVVNANEYYVLYGNNITEKYPLPADKTKELKVILMPDVSKVAVYDGTARILDYADTITKIKDLSGFKTVGDGLTVNSVRVETDQYGMLAVNLANIPYFAPFSKGVLKESAVMVKDTIVPCRLNWQSSDDSLITSEGVITTPNAYKFAVMTLNMSSVDNENVRLSVPVTTAIACGKDKNLLAGSKVSATEMDKPGYPIVYATDNDINTVYGISKTAKQPVITFDMGESKYINCMYISENFDNYENGVKSYVLTCSADGTEWKTLKSGTLNNPQDYLIAFNTTEARYLAFKITGADSKDAYFNEFEAYLFASSSEIAGLELDKIDLGIKSTVESDINLPSKGEFGTPFTWKSSRPDIISSDGKVTRPENGTTVKLTVTAVYDGIEYSRDIAVYVTGTKSAGGSMSGGGGSSGSPGGTGTSVVPGFTATDIAEKEDNAKGETVLFADIDINHWAYDSVKKLKELGIVCGDENGNFNPSDNVTREQFLKMLVETLEFESVNAETSFEDVDANSWYGPYVAVGTENKLINGISQSVFGVGLEITRQDMSLMIERVLNIKGVEIKSESTEFEDDALISEYAKNAVYKIRSAGIIQGYDNMFRPTDYLTRAEAAVVITKLIDLLQ